MNILNKVTLKTLAKNKTRTLVTIIGIILSTAMFTAVTTCISSLQNFLVEVVTSQDGDWHAAAFNIKDEKTEEVKSDTQVISYTTLQNIGYAALSGCENEYKPYLFVAGIADGFTDTLPVNLTDGRMPKNSGEIILPRHLKTNGGISYALGDTLDLSVGDRVSGGFVLTQKNRYLTGEHGETEELKISGKYKCTVVGFYERPSFENYSAPGYTALTVADKTVKDSYDIYIKLSKPKNIYSFMENNFPQTDIKMNSDVLRFLGVSNNEAFMSVLYGLASILIGIIMFGSVSLIYNAFSISVSERTKQFGLLSSIGSTKKQLLRSVLFEALSLSLIGISLGIIAGITGMGITFRLTEDLFISLLNTESDIALHLSVSWGAVIAACCVSLVTVLISAYIPARRATRISTIDAIRQTGDIKIKPRKVRTSKLTYKLFGFEGMIARKNFKRNKKRYKATVISLFLSVVLFISASSFCSYLSLSVDSIFEDPEYDIIYTQVKSDAEKLSYQELYKELSSISEITKMSRAYSVYVDMNVDTALVTRDYLEYRSKSEGNANILKSELIETNANIYFVDDLLYRDFLKANSLDESIYMNKESPKAVALDSVKFYDGKYHTFNLLNTQSLSVNAVKLKNIDGYYFAYDDIDENGKRNYHFKSNKDAQELILTAEQATENVTLEIGTITENKPFCVDRNYWGLTLIYPYSLMSNVMEINSDNLHVQVYFKSANYKAAFEKIYKVLDENDLSTSRLSDVSSSQEANRALIAVLNIFSYGFIILISLIAAANVFNTISTNIALRRRELAMLKSIGMTQKGFNKMMNYECLLYGIKGLMYGLPVSFAVTYLIYLSVRGGWETSFYIPWYSVAIAVGSVFAVVFATMLYSMNKIKKDNPIDALKNENL